MLAISQSISHVFGLSIATMRFRQLTLSYLELAGPSLWQGPFSVLRTNSSIEIFENPRKRIPRQTYLLN